MSIVYKILIGYDSLLEYLSNVDINSVTRGHNFKLRKPPFKRQFANIFSNKHVVNTCNSLPFDVVNTTSINRLICLFYFLLCICFWLCACMYYVFVYMYLCIYTNIFRRLSVYVYLYISLYVPLICLYVFVSLSVSYVFICLYACICI